MSELEIIFSDRDVAIRRFRREDAAQVAKQGNNLRLARNMSVLPYPYTEDAARGWIDRAQQPGKAAFWGVFHRDGFAGCVGFMWQSGLRSRTGKFGYWFGEAYWGQGLAAQAAKPVVDFAFDHFPQLARMEAEVLSENRASARVLERAGFALEGRHRQALLKGGELRDVLIYARVRPGSSIRMVAGSMPCPPGAERTETEAISPV